MYSSVVALLLAALTAFNGIAANPVPQTVTTSEIGGTSTTSEIGGTSTTSEMFHRVQGRTLLIRPNTHRFRATGTSLRPGALALPRYLVNRFVYRLATCTFGIDASKRNP
ncbi:predicted protein [Postia placenta Mad-698-R]|nr:predicted protein [Postia placenta Mad-698-R]